MAKREPHTKQRILAAALTLFSTKGYEPVTVAEIADAVGIKAPSLYKHYKSKQDIFEAIIAEMDARYKSLMSSMRLDGKEAEKDREYYANVSIDELVYMGMNLFRHYLHDEYVSKFRKLLTIEQYTNKKLSDVYIQRYVYDPLDYQGISFQMLSEAGRLASEDPRIMALHYYAPLFLLQTLCDSHPNLEPEALEMAEKHIRQFVQIYANQNQYKKENKTMKIANNVEMLEIKSERGMLYPVLVRGDNELVLIDTALPRQTDALREAVKEAGYSLEDISKVILTHQDLDHIGSAKTLSDMGAEILAHELETPYIQGDKTSIRLSDMESRLDELDDGERAFYERAKMGAPYFYVRVDKLLKDDDILDLCGGIRILHTPGHTPGHISVFLEESNIIVAGDAANISDGKLVGADPQFTRDIEQARKSFAKITGFNPASIVCYHGGLYTG